MPRARTQYQDEWQTAAVPNGSGCLSGYLLPPFAVILIACLLTIFALKTPIQTSALPMQNPVTISTGLSPIFTQEVQYWANDILRWANASSLDPNLAAVVMQIESCGDPRATSSAGAMGLFQVMPFHFHFGENPYDPKTNALRGLSYLARSLQTAQGNPRLALAGYNGGIGVIGRGEWTWSAQTARYVQYGAPIYDDARNGSTISPKLEEWYLKYGANLCKQAARRLGLP
jgi:hypothetical protein